MRETLKNLAIIFIILAFGVVIGYLIFERKPVEPIIVEPEIIENTQKIDSLLGIIKERDLSIEQLKDSIKTEIIEVEKLKDSIENLPIDQNTELLKANLLSFGTHSEETDTLPAILRINEDTIVAISEGNMIDINIGFSRLESQIFINRLQLQIINQDSLTMADQRNIIARKDVLLEKQQLACQQNTEDLKRQLKKEKISKTCWQIGGVVVSASLATLLILQLTK
jgi:hypothetical protein